MAKSRPPPPPHPPPFTIPPEIDPWITQTLVQHVFHNDLAPLTLALRAASRSNVPQLRAWGVLASARAFLLFASGMLAWAPSETCDGKLVYHALCALNFVFDQPPLNGPAFSTPIDPSSVGRPLAPLSKWLVEFSVRVGEWMSSPGSLSQQAIETFQASPRYNLHEALTPPGGWRTFNELFSRRLKPGMRPISAVIPTDPNYDRLPTYPADGTFDGAWPISPASKVVIKGLPWKIADLLQGSKYADAFEGGVWMHAFLNAFDYHRQHAPVAGTVVEANVVQGLCYLHVRADPDTGELRQHRSCVPPDGSGGDAVEEEEEEGTVPGTFDTPDDAGFQFLQTRGCVVIRNGLLGYVAVLPIGMAQVSSVKLAWEPADGESWPVCPMVEVEKGEEISHFEFGGSDVVVVFQKEAEMQILGAQGVDREGNLTNKQKYLVGMPLGFSMKGLS